MPFNATLPTAFCQNMVWIGREKEIKVRCIYQNHISLGTDRPTDLTDGSQCPFLICWLDKGH